MCSLSLIKSVESTPFGVIICDATSIYSMFGILSAKLFSIPFMAACLSIRLNLEGEGFTETIYRVDKGKSQFTLWANIRKRSNNIYVSTAAS